MDQDENPYNRRIAANPFAGGLRERRCLPYFEFGRVSDEAAQ